MLARLHDNLNQVRDRMAAACHRAGRPTDCVQLVAVTKAAPLDAIAGLIVLGQTELAENRPQQLSARQKMWPDAHWHLIGHLQRNKAKSIVRLTHLIHSVDSRRLAECLANLGATTSSEPRRVPVLLEVNISGEASKDGYVPSALWSEWDQLVALPGLEIRGLMTMAPILDDPQSAREVFAGLRELRDALQDRSPENVQLRELSMGMSGDFEAAILEGATLVRVGSRLFEGLS